MPEIAMITYPIRRADLEYPTEDVPLQYLYIIGKAQWKSTWEDQHFLFTKDSFTDKALLWFGMDTGNKYGGALVYGRAMDGGVIENDAETRDNHYGQALHIYASTADHKIFKRVAGTSTTLACENVDLYPRVYYLMMFSISGSTLKGFRTDLSTPKITATDTDLTNGIWGGWIGTHPRDDNTIRGTNFMLELKPPASELPKPVVIIEYDVKQITGAYGETINTPDMPEDLVEVDKTMVTPEEWETIQSNPKGVNGLPLINRLAVNWGAIDYKGEPTMLCAIYSSSPRYVRKDAILRHIEYARKKGHKVFKTSKSLTEARELYREIKRDRPDMLIEPEELAYQLIGSPELEPDSVACFYERELVNLNRIKGVPEWELERTLRRWEKLAEKYGRSEAKEKLTRIRRR